MSLDIYPDQKQKVDEHFQKEGFFPLRPIAEKYGYSKDHLARLIRTGRILGVRKGNNRGDWFVQEASVKKYHQDMVGKRFNDTGTQTQTPPILSPISSEPQNRESSISKPNQNLKEIGTTVLSIAPFKNEGSLNAEPRPSQGTFQSERQESPFLVKSGAEPISPPDASASVRRGLNAILTLTFVLGGILFFQVVDVPHASTQIWKKAEHSLPGFTKTVEYIFQPNLKNEISSISSLTSDFVSDYQNLFIKSHDIYASIWTTFLDWLFPTTTSPTYVTIEEFNQFKQSISKLSLPTNTIIRVETPVSNNYYP